MSRSYFLKTLQSGCGTTDVTNVVRFLESIYSGEGIPRRPSDPQSYELEVDEYVWYKHTDGRWYPAKVTGSPMQLERPPPDLEGFKGHNLWPGVIVGGQDWNRPVGKIRVYLCPTLGNAKPGNPYIRVLLQAYGELPQNVPSEHVMSGFKAILPSLWRWMN